MKVARLEGLQSFVKPFDHELPPLFQAAAIITGDKKLAYWLQCRLTNSAGRRDIVFQQPADRAQPASALPLASVTFSLQLSAWLTQGKQFSAVQLLNHCPLGHRAFYHPTLGETRIRLHDPRPNAR
jgi:hypothetical protein